MNVNRFVEILNADFYTGVPDSQLKALCDYLMDRYGVTGDHHLICANEGNCMAVAAGYHLATGKIPVIYMQNSGEGNVINPLASLMNPEVYGLPAILVIGWRGEPGVHDEPQHVYQGAITLKLLEDMGVPFFVVGKDTTEEELVKIREEYQEDLYSGRVVAFVIRKGALEFDKKVVYQNDNPLTREAIIREIVKYSGESPVVSTTGKASRELFEIREARGEGHEKDFLTVGSMGHSSSIALGIALQKKDRKVFCVDGDGAVLMHMGAMAVIGKQKPSNLVHIVINNGAHETVGGMPTVAGEIDLLKIAEGCGYEKRIRVGDLAGLDAALESAATSNELCFIEVKCAIGARSDLGRPTTTPQENKKAFMEMLKG